MKKLFKANEKQYDSNICFTTPEESKGKLRILRKNTQSNRVAIGGNLIEGIPRSLSSKNKRAYDNVSFDDIKNVYGSTPENTSSESNESLPDDKDYHNVYKAQDIDSPDKAFRKQDKIHIVGKEYNNTINPQAKNLPNEQKLSLDVSPPRSGHTTEIDNQMSMIPMVDGGLLKLSSKNMAEIKPGHEEMAVNTSYNNGTSAPPMIKNNADTPETTKYDVYEQQAIKDTKTISRNSNKTNIRLADSLSRKSSFDTNKSTGILKSVQAHTSIKSPPLVSSIPKPSVYINRPPVTLSNKDRGASTSGVKSDSPVALSTKGTGASTSGVKSDSPVALSTKGRGASTSGVKSSSPVTLSTKDKDATTSGVKPSSPAMDILGGSSMSKVQIQPGAMYNSHVSNGPVEKKSPVEITSLFYSQRKEEERDEHVQSTNPTNTAEDSLKSGTIESISTYSTSYKDPNEKVIKNLPNDIIPSDNADTNYTKVLAFPGHVGFKTPFQNGHNTKNAFDEELETENGYEQEDNNISRKHSMINSDYDKETLVSPQTIISDLTPGFTLQENPQNTTFNVFYAPGRKAGGETNTLNLSKYEERDPKKIDKFLNKDNMYSGNGPKGLLIFVNKKTIGSFDEFDDASLLTREDFPLHGSYRQRSSKLSTESSGDSEINPYNSSEWGRGKRRPKPKDTEKSSRPKSHSEDGLGRSGLFSKLLDKIRHTFGEPGDQRYKESNISDEPFEGHISPSMSKKSDRKSSRPKSEGSRKSRPIHTRHGYPKGSSDKGVSSQNKPSIVHRSPSGSKITLKYPCGCLRIITMDKDNEIETEELISAYCREGSLCEIQHPELQKNKGIIEVAKSPKYSSFNETISDPLSRCWFPNIEIVADGIISKNKIPERPPAPTMKGAKLAGSINIKTDKLDGVCNFYFDPRLLRYLIANIDEVKAAAEEFRGH